MRSQVFYCVLFEGEKLPLKSFFSSKEAIKELLFECLLILLKLGIFFF